MADEWSPTAYYVYGDVVTFEGQQWIMSVAGVDYVLGSVPQSGSTLWTTPLSALPAIDPNPAQSIRALNVGDTAASISMFFDPAKQVTPVSAPYALTVSGGAPFIAVSDFPASAIQLSGLTPSTTYNVTSIGFTNSNGTVTQAYNAQGLPSATPGFSFTTAPAAPLPITNVVASAITATGFTVTWVGGDGVPADFDFALNDLIAVPQSVTATTAVFVNLNSSTSYDVVISCNNGGGVVFSAPITVVTLPPPPAPPVTPITAFALAVASGNTANFTYSGGQNASVFSFLLNGSVYNNAVFDNGTVGVGGLTISTNYTAQIILSNDFGVPQLSSIIPFQTTAVPTPNVTPISVLQVAGAPTQTTANLLYVGGDNSTVGLLYIGSVVYGSAVFDLVAKTVAITGLTQNTTYNFTIVLSNGKPSSATSPLVSFATAGPTPPPTNPSVTPITDFNATGAVSQTSVICSYFGGDNATIKQAYLNGSLYPSAVFSDPKTVIYTGLAPGTTYSAYITLDNNNFQPETSGTIRIQTLPGPAPPPVNLTSVAVVTFLLKQNGVWLINSDENPKIGSFILTGPNAGTIQGGGGAAATCDYLSACQARGVKVIVSLGGATGNLGDMFPDEGSVFDFLSTFQNVLQGGPSGNILNWSNATFQNTSGNQFFFDGLDLDFEQTTSSLILIQFWQRINFIVGIKSMAPVSACTYFNSDVTKPYTSNGDYLPFASADAALTTLNPPIPSAIALINPYYLRAFDRVFIQTYNQDPAIQPGGASFTNIIAQWGFLCVYFATASTNANTKIVLGFGANDVAFGPTWDQAVMAPIVSQAILDATAIIKAVPGYSWVQPSDWLAGAGYWTSPLSQTYLAQNYDSAVGAIPNLPAITCYSWASAAYPAPDPVWTNLPIIVTRNNPPVPPPPATPVTPITGFNQVSVGQTSAVFGWAGGDNATINIALLNGSPYSNVVFSSSPKTVTVNGLTSAVQYTISISLNNITGPAQTSPTLTFTTTQPVPPTPPAPGGLKSLYVVNFLLYDGAQWVISQQNTPDIGQWFLTGPVAGQIQNNSGRAVIPYLKSLQAQGVKVILSMGGGGLTPAILAVMFNNSVSTAQSIYSALLNKGVGSNPLNFAYAGSAWEGFAFDGFDMDVEGNTPLPNDQLVVLQTLRSLSPTIELTAAPQAPNLVPNNPFGGNANGNWYPFTASPPETPTYVLPPINPAADTAAWMNPPLMRQCGLDYIFVQFYNQGPSWYPGTAGTSFGTALAQWGYLCLLSQTTLGTGCKIIMGFTTNDGQPIWSPSTDGPATNTAITFANSVIRREGGIYANVTPDMWLAGIGFWNSPTANSVTSTIYSPLSSGGIPLLPVDACMLWQANQQPPPNPNWTGPITYSA